LAEPFTILSDDEFEQCAAEERRDTPWMVHPAFGQVKAAHRYFDLGKIVLRWLGDSRTSGRALAARPL
jgi:hypothetical protein